jgi:thermostable 8-oxoguanine DNA glycosylase
MDAAEIDLAERQARLIYAIVVAGKSAKFTDRVMNAFHAHRQQHLPFDFIRLLIEEENLGWVLRDMRCGNYRKIERALTELVKSDLDLMTCTPAQLQAIHGIGPKTARFFILWTRPGERYAALDVHILRWLRQWYNAPESTPQNENKYRTYEILFLAEADKRGLTARELDSQIWDAAQK